LFLSIGSVKGNRKIVFVQEERRKKAEHHYWRVILTYSDNGTSGNRVFKDREKAEEWAARQKKSPVVKKVALEPFVRQQYVGRRVSKLV
jgi:hypothetical protein